MTIYSFGPKRTLRRSSSKATYAGNANKREKRAYLRRLTQLTQPTGWNKQEAFQGSKKPKRA